MNNRTKKRGSVYEWYLPDLELDSFIEKKTNEKEVLYIQENKRRIFLQWNEDEYENLEKNLEYGSLILRFFMDSLKNDDQRALFELGTLKGVVESFEHLLHKKGEELRLQKARYTFFSAVKHLDDVVFALETHGSMTQTELCKYMRNMNASTLSEAMKKILKTGLVMKTALGKYRIYTLSDTGLEYGKLIRRGKENFELPKVLKLLRILIDQTHSGQEKDNLKKQIVALFENGNDIINSDKPYADFINITFDEKLKNRASFVAKPRAWRQDGVDGDRRQHDVNTRISHKQKSSFRDWRNDFNTWLDERNQERPETNIHKVPVSVTDSIINNLKN